MSGGSRSDGENGVDVVLIAVVTYLLCVGEPDIIDAIIYFLMK